MTTSPPAILRDRIKRLTTIDIADIVGFEAGNPVARTDDDRHRLGASLEVNGYVSPVLVRELRKKDEGGWLYELIDGHGRIEEIRARYPGVEQIKVLVIDCESVAEGKNIILGLRQQAAWDMDSLDEWVRSGLEDGLDLEQTMAMTGLSAADLDSLAADLDDVAPRLEAGSDKVDPGPSSAPADATHRIPGMVVEVDIPDELPKKTVSKPGTIWTLGSSRLVCGDSTTAESVAAALGGERPHMIWTDPPWNVAYNSVERPSGRGAKSRPKMTIMNDALGDKFGEFAAGFCRQFAAVAAPGTPIYVAMSTQEWGVIDAELKKAGFHGSSVIIWAKQALVLGRKDFHSQYEPIWYGWREGAPRRCAPTDRAMSDLWMIDRPRKSELHPTMKPVALVARSISASSHPGDLVLDPFGGSGTTLLAAEQLGRRSSLVELDPAYADVIVERWQALTGRKASKSRT